MSHDPPSEEPLRRLHPLTPLLTTWKTYTVVGAVLAVSWGDELDRVEWLWDAVHGDVALGRLLLVVLLILVLALVVLAASYVSWRVTGYAMTTDAEGHDTLLVKRGVVFRTRTSTRLDRVQAVDLNQTFVARVLGLAEVRLNLAAGGDASTTLAYLTLADAQDVQTELERRMTRSETVQAPTEDPDGVALATVRFSMLAKAALLELVPLMVPAVLLLVAYLVAVTVWGTTALIVGAGLLLPTGFGLIGLVAHLIRQLLHDGDFTVVRTPRGVRVEAGVLSRRTQSVDTERVQGVRLEEPMLWRRLGWARVVVEVAGDRPSSSESASRSRRALLPVGPRDQGIQLVRDVFGVDVTSGQMAGVPRPARWLDPLQGSRLGVVLAGPGAVSRYGWWTLVHAYVPYARAQSLTVRQGPCQRRLGLATVYADGTLGTTRWNARHRDQGDAARLTRELARRQQSHLVPAPFRADGDA